MGIVIIFIVLLSQLVWVGKLCVTKSSIKHHPVCFIKIPTWAYSDFGIRAVIDKKQSWLMWAGINHINPFHRRVRNSNVRSEMKGFSCGLK
jgi:hypothetical protein